jgi:hypothetical protein
MEGKVLNEILLHVEYSIGDYGWSIKNILDSSCAKETYLSKRTMKIKQLLICLKHPSIIKKSVTSEKGSLLLIIVTF